MTTAHWHRNLALLAPLLLVNTAAIYGQSGWAHEHLGHNWTIAVLFALAVESIGVFLAAEAHAALMAGHASGTLRIGSYAVGALVGVLNFAHYATQPGYRPNPLAVTFGLLSSISPWLWSIRSRSMNREHLAEMGLIDPRAVKFSRLRWALFPARTFVAFRTAVWAGIQRPDEAVAAADRRRTHRRPDTTPEPAAAAAPAHITPEPVAPVPSPADDTTPAIQTPRPQASKPARPAKRQPSAADRVARGSPRPRPRLRRRSPPVSSCPSAPCSATCGPLSTACRQPPPRPCAPSDPARGAALRPANQRRAPATCPVQPCSTSRRYRSS